MRFRENLIVRHALYCLSTFWRKLKFLYALCMYTEISLAQGAGNPLKQSGQEEGTLWQWLPVKCDKGTAVYQLFPQPLQPLEGEGDWILRCKVI